MSLKEKLKEEIEGLPEDLLEEVFDFIQFIEFKKTGQWSAFALESGSFDFWNEPEETDYSLDDLKRGK